MLIFSQFGEIAWQRLFNIVRILQTIALKRTLQWLVHSRLSPQFSGNGVQLFLSPDEAGSIIENRDGENLRQTQIATKSLRLSCPIVKQERQTRLNNL